MGQQNDDRFKERLLSTVIAIPLQEAIRDAKKKAGKTKKPEKPIDVIIDLNLDCRGGRDAARRKVRRMIDSMNIPDAYSEEKNRISDQYFFAKLLGDQIRELVKRDQSEPFTDSDFDPTSLTPPSAIRERSTAERGSGRATHVTEEDAIYHIWPDFPVRPLISRSISTVKADAAHRSFIARGRDIVWAVMDSGVEHHPHFDAVNDNLKLTAPLTHRDFTVNDPKLEQPLHDVLGHGTHVAGIIAGEIESTKEDVSNGKRPPLFTVTEQRDESGNKTTNTDPVAQMTGMAPECKIISLKVLDDQGAGPVSNLIAAITYIQEINGYGRRLLIHGVNMSVGYDFDPEWFACGQSPLCVEVNRLVRSGVVVVVAAGNTGYVLQNTFARGRVAAGASLTINDPGNADLAITVGSTHRDMPHVYGVSYFSSKGPTGDGRLKPDILAPGEKILSCAAESKRPSDAQKDAAYYVQDSGTSMAAPHVSGIIAAFLSIRREFIGQPEQVKKIFINSATDLGRERYFQGNGLVDLMRAIQSV